MADQEEQRSVVQEARAHARFVRIAPRKVRVVVDLIRGRAAEEAMATLRYTPKRASRLVYRVLRSAVANAEENLDWRRADLVVSRAVVDNGPTLKRIHPRQRGRAFDIKKHMAHVTVCVRPKEL